MSSKSKMLKVVVSLLIIIPSAMPLRAAADDNWNGFPEAVWNGVMIALQKKPLYVGGGQGVIINDENSKGTIIGLKNKTWDKDNVVSGRAVTEDQLKSALEGVSNVGAGNAVSTDASKGIAGAAALSALRPFEYDGVNKWSFMMGTGAYKGENALALGVAYRPNENTLLSAGFSHLNGENLINAGVSLKLGKGENIGMSKSEMVEKINKQEKEIESLKKEFQEIKNLMKK